MVRKRIFYRIESGPILLLDSFVQIFVVVGESVPNGGPHCGGNRGGAREPRDAKTVDAFGEAEREDEGGDRSW